MCACVQASWSAGCVGVPLCWTGVDLALNQRCLIRDYSVPVQYSKLVRMVNVTAKGFYVLTHNVYPVKSARSHSYKVFLQLGRVE